MDATPTLRVMALHALAYCERLFYLEEVEELRVADERVWAGRRLHEELDEPAEVVELVLESEELGLRGKLDAVRRRDGATYPIEHKRGRSRKGDDGKPTAWDTDKLQAWAYALLLEEHLGAPVVEARVRYHADNVTVRLEIGEAEREAVRAAVARGRELARCTTRPPVTTHERRCVRCSLAPVCLPEETRFTEQETVERSDETAPLRLYPPDVERRTLHIVTQGAHVGRSGESFRVTGDELEKVDVGAREVSDIVLHGHAQITTQALRLCADQEIPVHFVTASGAHIGMFAGPSGGVQRRIRQYRGLSDDKVALALARRIVAAKVENQLRHLLRASRAEADVRAALQGSLDTMRASLRGAVRAGSRDELIGHEGAAARAYFAAFVYLVTVNDERFRPDGRSRRPPRDRFNALLSFAYGLLYRDVLSVLIRVGLEPALGVLHQPRSAAYPLVLDLMELFRVPVVDLAIVAAVNRRMFDPEADFAVTGSQVWLSEAGRKKLIGVYERRKHEEYRHPALEYSLSYARMMELEARLLEKEWSGEAGPFARFRLR